MRRATRLSVSLGCVAALVAAACGTKAAPASPGGAQAVCTAPGVHKGGYSPSFDVAGDVENASRYALSDLQKLPAETQTVQSEGPEGPRPVTYTGVPLYSLLMTARPRFDPVVKNDAIRWYVCVGATDGYAAVIAWGEIDPRFAGKEVLVAYEADGRPLAGKGMAQLVVPGDKGAGRYVSNIEHLALLRAQGTEG